MASAVLQMHKQGGLIGTVKTEAHKVMEFRILRGARRTQSKIIVLDFRRADFGLFKDHLDRVPWDHALKGKEARNLVNISHLLS